MRKTFLCVCLALATNSLRAQNIFPSTGAAGIGTSSPTHSLTFGSSATGAALYNTADQTTNFERARLSWSANTFLFQTEIGGTGTARNIRIYSNGSNLNVGNNTGTNSAVEVRRDGTALKTLFGVSSTGLTGTSGQQYAVVIVPTISQTATAGYNGIFISPFEQSIGSGTNYLLNIGTNTAANGSGTHTSKFVVTNTGKIGIGTATPAEELSVNGNIRAKQIKVETANWPDFVFDNQYKLVSLTELNDYIAHHKHLPEIPSEIEILANGQNIGEINRLLLKKVEELTLYLIESERKNTDQEKRLKKLEQALDQFIANSK